MSTKIGTEERCTCHSGRDYDGSEFGPCSHCEQESDREREAEALTRDAARWRVSQIRYQPKGFMTNPGFFVVDTGDDFRSGVSVGIQPHPYTGETALNGCILGEHRPESGAPDIGLAIDDMFRTLDRYVEEGAVLEPLLEAARSLAARTATYGDVRL